MGLGFGFGFGLGPGLALGLGIAMKVTEMRGPPSPSSLSCGGMPCVWLLFQSPLKKARVPECSHGLDQVLVCAAQHLHRFECSSVSVRNMPRRLLPREKQAVPG